MKCPWYIRSVEYLRTSSSQIVETVDDLPLPVSDDEDRNVLSVAVYGDEVDGKTDNDIPVAGGDEGAGETSMCNEVPEFIHDDVVGGQPDDHEQARDNQGDVGVTPEDNEKDVPEPSSVNACVSPDRSLELPHINKELIEAEVQSIKTKVVSVEKQLGDVDGKHLLHEISSLKMRIGVVERALGIKFSVNLYAPNEVFFSYKS